MERLKKENSLPENKKTDIKHKIILDHKTLMDDQK